MKTVLLSAYTCCPNQGSEPGNGWSWVMGYHNNGYQVHCLTSGRYKKEIDTFVKSGGYANIRFVFIETIRSTSILKIPIFGEYLHYYNWIIFSRKYLKKNIKSISIDHIHHVTYSSIKFGTPVYNFSYPTVVGPLGGSSPIHKTLHKYLMGGDSAEKLKQGFGKILIRLNPSIKKTIHSANLLLYSNNTTLQFLNTFNCGKVAHMFDAGLPDYYKQPYKKKIFSNTINILWVGKIMGWKGLNLAVETMKYLPLKYRLIVVGDGKHMTTIRDQIEKLKLNNAINLKGKLIYNELLPIYKAAHIFLFPSLKDSCPMQVFEAMANGLPVITLNHQGMQDQVIEGTGIKVDVDFNINYPVQLAKAIENLMDNESIYHQFSFNAYQFGQQQIWSNRITDFLNNLNF